MADKTKIEWADATWNPITGCSVVSPGCTNCYAMRMAARLEKMLPPEHRGEALLPNQYAALTQPSKKGPVWTGRVNLAPERVLTAPLRRRKPTRYFVNSMSDLFHEAVPDEWIDRVFAVMAGGRKHTFQVLTKRPERMRDYLSRFKPGPAWDGFITRDGVAHTDRAPGSPVFHPGRWPLPNVWLGVSAEDQARAGERIPLLLDTPAAVRFLSAEPLLGPIDLERVTHRDRQKFCWLNYDPSLNALTGNYPLLDGSERRPHPRRLNWVIAGGESGPGARPPHPDWFRSLRDQCQAAGVPFFFKQWGEWAPFELRPYHGRGAPIPTLPSGLQINLRHRQTAHFGPDASLTHVGNKAAGRLLDGRTWDEMPEVRR